MIIIITYVSWASGLGVMTSPLQGGGHRFNSGLAHTSCEKRNYQYTPFWLLYWFYTLLPFIFLGFQQSIKPVIRRHPIPFIRSLSISVSDFHAAMIHIITNLFQIIHTLVYLGSDKITCCIPMP